jgi:hypothetical protein
MMDNKEKYTLLLAKLYSEGNFNFETDNELLSLKAQALNISEEIKTEIYSSRSKSYKMIAEFINKMGNINNQGLKIQELTAFCEDLDLYNQEIEIFLKSFLQDEEKKVVKIQVAKEQISEQKYVQEEYEEKEHMAKSILKAFIFLPSLAFKITLPMAKYSTAIGWFGAYLVSAMLWPVWIGSFFLALLYRRFAMRKVNSIANS